MENARLHDLLVVLGHLTEASRAGHKVASEMNLVIEAILKEMRLR